jgi:glycosyltransferase involved in cell wall biosynthesis
MKIAVVTETYPPEVNGVALTVHTLVSEMAAAGHDLLLVRPDQPGVSAVPPANPIRALLVPGAPIPKYPGLRLVATGFHTRFDCYARSYGLGPLSPLAHRWLRRLHNASSATIVPTMELGGWLEERGFQRVQVIARSVDTALFDPARRNPRLRDREHGRLVPRGNGDGFIAAAAALSTVDGARRGMREAARAATLALRPEQVARDFVGLLAGLPARAAA